MQRQELITLFKANPDRLCKDLGVELEQDAKDYIKELMGWSRFVPNTRCSTILERLGVSGDDAEEVGVEEDSDDTGDTMSPSADEVISFLERNPQLQKYCNLPPNIKEGYRSVLGVTIVGSNTNCTTLLKNLSAKIGRGAEGGYIPRIPAEGGGGGGIASHDSLLSVDDSGDTMSQASSPSQGTRHEPYPQTGGIFSSWFGTGQSANTSQYSDGDPQPGAAEPEPEPVMVKSDVLRIINWFKEYIGRLKDDNQRLMNTMTSMQGHIRDLESMPKNHPHQFLNVEELMRVHTSDL